MKNSVKITAGIFIFFAVVWACTTKHSVTTAVMNANGLPQNVLVSCTVTKDTFNTWFKSGQATENGVVNPANSLGFPHNNNCDFYTWAEHMFLWITSKATGPYGNSGSVLESPVFYNVSPENAQGQRTLTAHVPNLPLKFTAHVNKNGPDRLPVILSKTGKMFEVEALTRNANTLQAVKGADGKVVQVGSVKLNPTGQATFLDKTGKEIQHPTAVFSHKVNRKNVVEEFLAGTKPIFLDADGNQVQTEAGQATGDVLMDQHGSLVYYLSLVNDVYAWYLTASKNGYMPDNEFPTKQTTRDSICAYARMNHAILPDSNALAIEIKSSWVEASTLPDSAKNYFTVMATIPTYDTTNKVKWIPTGEKTVKMALTGMHVVGSVANHPEMVWSTFEHQQITPNALYTYVDVNNNVDTVKQDTGSNWLFTNNAGYASPNVSHMTNTDSITNIVSDTIFANPGFNISASNTLMINPWGSALGSPTNQEDKSSAASNSEILSINNTIYGLLVGNDLRKNYLLIGATWTFGGAPPTGTSYGYGGDTAAGVSIGTSVLANSTMETYFQSAQFSCFTCHSSNPAGLTPTDLSHIFGGIQPLPTIVNNSIQKKKQ
jgi:hypothetical protein